MDFEQGTMEVRDTTNFWGPFCLDFTDGIPTGEDIQSVEIKAYSGKVTPKLDLADFVEVTNLVEAVGTIISENTVSFRLQYPGAEYKGTKMTLILTVILASGGRHPFYFYPVKVM